MSADTFRTIFIVFNLVFTPGQRPSSLRIIAFSKALLTLLLLFSDIKWRVWTTTSELRWPAQSACTPRSNNYPRDLEWFLFFVGRLIIIIYLSIVQCRFTRVIICYFINNYRIIQTGQSMCEYMYSGGVEIKKKKKNYVDIKRGDYKRKEIFVL